MNLDQYQSLAMATCTRKGWIADLVHAALGLATEGGEFTTEVKRINNYGKQLTPQMHDHMVEELGDVLWYVALAASALDVEMSVIAEMNIEKLRKRYPEGFTHQAAEARADKGGADARSS